MAGPGDPHPALVGEGMCVRTPPDRAGCRINPPSLYTSFTVTAEDKDSSVGDPGLAFLPPDSTQGSQQGRRLPVPAEEPPVMGRAACET